MMFLHKLTDWLRKRPEVKTPKARSSARLRLEELEDRVVPSFTTATYTNATIQINPGFTVTETVTAQVTPFPAFNFTPGSPGTNPIPTGATNPTGGKIFFSLNNLQQSATVNSNGQATATFQVPLLAFLTSQTLGIQYQGFTDGSGNTWDQSTFLAPIYKNWDNVLVASTITFNQLTPQQVYAQDFQEWSTNPSSSSNITGLNPYYTAAGEQSAYLGGAIVFNYIDPGIINSVTALGINFPGSVALQLRAFNGFNIS